MPENIDNLKQFFESIGFKTYLENHASNPGGVSFMRTYDSEGFTYVVGISFIGHRGDFAFGSHMKGNNSVFCKRGDLDKMKQLLHILFNQNI